MPGGLEEKSPFPALPEDLDEKGQPGDRSQDDHRKVIEYVDPAISSRCVSLEMLTDEEEGEEIVVRLLHQYNPGACNGKEKNDPRQVDKPQDSSPPSLGGKPYSNYGKRDNDSNQPLRQEGEGRGKIEKKDPAPPPAACREIAET